MHGSLMACNHIAIIMDGNGRWAKSRGLPRLAGHKRGAKSVENIVEACRELNVKYLTLFSFSTENWGRSLEEINGLMRLFKHYLASETKRLKKTGIRFRALGEIDRFQPDVIEAIRKSEEETKDNTEMNLILALSYGGREEILAATKNIAEQVQKGEISPDQIDHALFRSSMWSADIPDPDLLIRTSAEMRISNFLLWQLAYSEIIITEELWPDFNKESLKRCIEEFDSRERRFGLTSEQVANNEK